MYDIERNEFVVSRDVVFKENVFPYSGDSPSLSQVSTSSSADKNWLVAPMSTARGSSIPAETEYPQEHVLEPVPESVSESAAETENPQEPVSENAAETENPQEPLSETVVDSSTRNVDTEITNVVAPTDSFLKLGRGLRQKTESVKLKDYVTYNVVCSQDPHHAPPVPTSQSSSVQGNTLYPLSHYISDECFSPNQRAFFAAITTCAMGSD